jgi:hypothetical protein
MTGSDVRAQFLSVANTILAKPDEQIRELLRHPVSRARTEAFVDFAAKEHERVAPIFEAADKLRRLLKDTEGERRL